MYERDQLFIDGKWTAPESAEAQDAISVISPHSEQVIGHAACAGPADVNRAVDAARAAFDSGPWPRMQPGERIEALNRLAGIYKERRADMATLISAEIGAPITFAKMAQVRSAAHHAAGVLRFRGLTTSGSRNVRACTARTFGS